MRNILISIFIVVFTMSISGCATIVCGTSQKVPVSSDPMGATVNVDGTGSYTTPTVLNLQRKRGHILVFTKEGYKQETVTLLRVISGAVAGNIILGGFIGWGVDALTGAQWKLVPENVNVVM